MYSCPHVFSLITSEYVLQLLSSETPAKPFLGMAEEETKGDDEIPVPATPKDDEGEEEPVVKKKPAGKSKASGKPQGSPAKPPPTPKQKPGSKAKAKAKPKPGAKKKVEPKKRTKPKTEGSGSKGTMKRPATKKELKEDQKKAKTGAASAWGTPLCQDEKAAEEEDEEEVLEDDPVEENTFALAKKDTEKAPDTKDTKDRSKNNKFLKMLETKQLPSWLVDAWNATKKMGTGKLDRQRAIVNEAFDHADGKLVLNTNKPVFQEMRQTFTKTEAKSSQKSLPKSLFMGQFNLSEQLFEAGLLNGDFQEVIDSNGKKKYAWLEDEHIETKGKSSMSTQQESQEGQAADKVLFQTSARQWKIGLFEQSSSSTGAASGTPLLSLEDEKRTLSEKQWNAAQEMLAKAVGAMGRFLTSGDRLLQQVGVDKKDSELWVKLCLACIPLDPAYM